MLVIGLRGGIDDDVARGRILVLYGQSIHLKTNCTIVESLSLGLEA
jgi:hypothetical protein